MARFTFDIKGSFETDETSLALLQLSHLAEVAKVNIADKVKLEFTDIRVQKDAAPAKPTWLKSEKIPAVEMEPLIAPNSRIITGLIGTNVMQDDLDTMK